MLSLRRALIGFIVFLIPVLLLGLVLATASAALPVSPVARTANVAVEDTPLAGPTTTLAVAILSSPWATLDSNDPAGLGGPAPNVFVVQALVVNTGTVTATDVTITLDYGLDDPAGWILVDGEDSLRGIADLAPGAAQNLYWLARYPATDVTSSHRYTVTATADNAEPISTSDNVYGNPAPEMTVETLHALSAGNSGIVSYVSGDIVVGVPFTISVYYDLGSNPDDVMFSPVGNPDFAAGAFRLVATSVRLFNDSGSQQLAYSDQLYFPSLPAFADNAEATYTWIAIRGEATRLCSYADVGFGSNYKYDQFYCEGTRIVPITGTVELLLDKQVSAAFVQQGQALTYTIRYTNTGTWALTDVWIWDDIDPSIGWVITESITPPTYDPDELAQNRLAWYLGDIASGAGGILSYTTSVDGGGNDLADGVTIVNHAFYGIGAGTRPAEPALTATVTTTVRAPVAAVTKTDLRSLVQVGERLTYTLAVTNDGSIPAMGVVITDLLPSFVIPDGPTIPITDSQDGPILVWTSLGAIPPAGGHVSITIPCRVVTEVPNGAILTNTMVVVYGNELDYRYHPAIATDVTAVEAPVLTLLKRGTPDPVGNGSLLTYTLQYTNSGPADASSVIVTDRVPISTTYTGCAGGEWCGETNGVVSWWVGNVPSETMGAPLGFLVQTDSALQTGDVIVNWDYGILSQEVGYVPGPPVSVTVVKQTAVIEGYVYDDTDGDGVFDPDELGIPEVVVALLDDLSTMTDGQGHYSFTVEVGGVHVVTETDPVGYHSTTPNEVHVAVVLGNTYAVDFGDTPGGEQAASIHGTVFDDSDGDSEWDPDELGIPGVTLMHQGEVTTTGEYGAYSFSVSEPGEHTVMETDLEGYVSTTPNTVTVIVELGEGYQVDFGDVLAPDCTCPPDGFEDDDDWMSAVPLAPGESQARDFCDDAMDWIVFQAELGSVYTMTTNAWGQRTDTFLTLLASDGATILATNDDYEGAGDYSSRIVWQAQTGGTHYLCTTNRAALSGCSTGYDLWLLSREEHRLYLPVVLRNQVGQARRSRTPMTPEGVIDHSCPDPYEVDDTWETATPLIDGLVQAHSFDSDPSLYAADKDWLGFGLSSGQIVTMTILQVTNTATLLELFDGDGDLLAQTEASRLVWEAQTTGLYLVAVSPLTLTFGCVDMAGYQLVGVRQQQHRLFLPVLLR